MMIRHRAAIQLVQEGELRAWEALAMVVCPPPGLEQIGERGRGGCQVVSEERRARALELVDAGMSHGAAGREIGVVRTTVSRWVSQSGASVGFGTSQRGQDLHIRGKEVSMSTPTAGIWTYRETTWAQQDLTGYKVEARDGSIGKIDKANNDVGSAFFIVDTGPWILGKKVMIPAGAVRQIDPDTETVFVDRTKDDIKNAPEYDEDRFADQAYRDQLGQYYDDVR